MTQRLNEYSKLQTCTPAHQKRVLCLWLPNWPIQSIVVAQSELRRQRVILFTQHAQRGRLVSAVSPLAARNGIVIDMPISEAKSLLRRSNQVGQAGTGNFHVLEHDRTAELAALEDLADSLTEFSPIIGLTC